MPRQYEDINNLRQQNLFANYGMGNVGFQNPYAPPEPQLNPFAQQPGQQPENANPFSALRNPFGVSNVSNVSTQPTTPKKPSSTDLRSNDIEDLVGLTNRLYTPETRATERFNKLLDEAPELNNPSLARSIFGGMINFGANAKGKDIMDNSDRVNYAPYAREQAIWDKRAGPYQQAAQLENTANINERTLAGNMATQLNTMQRNRQTEENNAERNRIAEIRATAYAFKARNPNWIIKEQGERTIAYNPQTLEQQDLGPSFGMTRRDEIELQNEGRIQAAAASVGNMLQSPDGTVWERDAKSGEWRPAKGGPTVQPTTPQSAPQPTVTPGGIRVPPPAEPPPQNQGLQRIPTGDDTPPKAKTAAELELQRNQNAKGIYQANPHLRNYFSVQGDTYRLRKRPDYGWFTGDATDEAKMKEWDDIATILDPNYVAPPYRSHGGGGPPSASSPAAPVQRQPAPPLERSGPPLPPTIGDFQQPGTGPTKGLGPSVNISLSPDGRIVGGQPGVDVRPPIPPGKIRVRDSNGREGFASAGWTDEQLAAEGYTRVK